MHTRWS